MPKETITPAQYQALTSSREDYVLNEGTGNYDYAPKAAKGVSKESITLAEYETLANRDDYELNTKTGQYDYRPKKKTDEKRTQPPARPAPKPEQPPRRDSRFTQPDRD